MSDLAAFLSGVDRQGDSTFELALVASTILKMYSCSSVFFVALFFALLSVLPLQGRLFVFVHEKPSTYHKELFAVL